MTDWPPAMTVRELGVYLNVNEKTIDRLAQPRELPGFEVAGAWRLRPEDIHGWVEGQKDATACRANRIALPVERQADGD